MAVRITIDGLDLQSQFGVVLEDGGLEKFEMPPTPKEPFFNEWPDASGKDYDTTSAVVYETQSFEIPFLMSCRNMTDYKNKKKMFLQLIDGNFEFPLRMNDYALAFYLRYKGASEWRILNVSNSGIVDARMVLKFENNHRPVPDDGSKIKVLADSEGRLLIIDNKLIQINI